MEKFITATGKTIDLAIAAALEELHMDRDSVSVEVLENPRSGFLGIGAQPARVKVTYEAPDEAPKPALSSASRSKPKKPAESKPADSAKGIAPAAPKVIAPAAPEAPRPQDTRASAPKAPQQLRQERREQIRQIGSVKLEVEEGELRSKMVIEAKHVCKTFGDREIVKDFSTRIIKGNKIGIVGPNGAGKTTLIKLLTKRLEPDSGHVRIGKNLEEAYFDQNRLTLDPKKTLWKTLCNEGDHIFVRGSYRHVVAYLKDFLFRPDQAQCPVSALSGGEKNRLMLAVALAQPSNFLVLDEPTNDLDMDTLDLLQEVLDEYEGTILLVSHDRDFIDRVVTSVIYMPGDGSVSEHAGSYSDLLEKLKSKIPAKKENKKEALPRKEEKPKSETKKTGRLSYNQQRLLEILPGKISELEKQIGDTEAALSDSSLYTENPEKFDALTTQLEKLKAELEKSENQWLEIEMLRESIGA